MDIDYEQSTKRLFLLTTAIGVAGAAVGAYFWGASSGAGFAIGSAASLVNLWIWHTIAEGLGGKSGKKTVIAGTLFAGRLLALFAFGYAIVKALNVQPLAAILGLLSSSFAVIAEILVQLVAGERLNR